MDVSTVTPVSTQASKSNAVLTQNFDTFLKLLTAQLQNQDPLEPMDAAQFTQQLVQYSGVEQGIYTNKNLETLIAMQQTGGMSSAVNYIGREIDAPISASYLKDGAANWTYSLPTDAASVQLVVKDAAGKAVYAGTGPMTSGTHTVAWDGKLANGSTAPEGIYTIEVIAKTAGGEKIAAPVNFTGRVTGIEMLNGQVVLNAGGVKLYLTDVSAVREIATTPVDETA